MPRCLSHTTRMCLEHLIVPRSNEDGKPSLKRLKCRKRAIHAAESESSAHEENGRQSPMQAYPLLCLHLS